MTKKNKSTLSAPSILVTLTTLWMSAVTAEAAPRGPWGTSQHAAVALRRHHPFAEDPVAELVRDTFYSSPIYPNSLLRQQQGGSYYGRKEDPKPHFDISESEDGTVELTMELPGLSVHDLNVEIENGQILRISGVRTRHKNGYISRKEFNEAIRLKDTMDVDKIRTNLSAGILTVTIPEKAKTIKKLPVQSNEGKSILDQNTEHGNEVDSI